jgi:hypothetical protein
LEEPFGRTSNVAEALKPISKQPLWPVWLRRADSTAFSVSQDAARFIQENVTGI